MPAHGLAAVGGELEPQPIVERGGVDVGEHASLLVEEEAVPALSGAQVLDVRGDQAVEEPVPIAAAQLEAGRPRQVDDGVALSQRGGLSGEIAVVPRHRDAALVHESSAEALVEGIESERREPARASS